MSRSTVSLLALALAALPSSAAHRTRRTCELELSLPDGPAARAWAGVGPATEPRPLADTFVAERAWLLEPLPDAGSAALGARMWEAWGRWLGEAANAGGEAPVARTGLALIALRSERWADAWREVAALAGHPECVAALMPHLLPGAPLDGPADAGGFPAPLPEGVLLRPALPPALESEPSYGIAPRRARVSGFRIGEALLELEVTVEPAGVQVDLRHLGGGPARLAVLLPEPSDQEIRVEYIDWFRQDDRHAPLAVELVPGGEPRTLFGRFLPREPDLPAPPPQDALPRTIELGGLWIEVGPQVQDAALPRAAVEALGRVLGVPAGLCAPLDPPPRGAYAGVILRYSDAAQGELLLRRVASAAEKFLLP